MSQQIDMFCASNDDAKIDLSAFEGHRINVCFGGGVDSTAMLVAMKRAGIVPDVITFADTGVEKPETYEHVLYMNDWLIANGFPTVTWCKRITKDDTPYNDLGGNVLTNETLPSLAFGMKSCSISWKQGPQDKFLKGATKGPAKCDPHPIWIESQETGRKVLKLIGYDASPADIRRSSKIKTEDEDFLYAYPLQQLGWTRDDCVKAILEEGLNVPIKSACYMCPASKQWELFWLAGNHPELFERAMLIERTALLGKHSRFDTLQFGNWDVIVSSKEKHFPSGATSVGLGRSFSWCKFGVDEGFVDAETWAVDRTYLDVLREKADELRNSDNALDGRSC